MKAKPQQDYGFISYYLVNDAHSIRLLAESCGFSDCKFIYLDSPKDIAKYFPSGLKWIPFIISHIMVSIKVPEKYYSDIICEITK